MRFILIVFYLFVRPYHSFTTRRWSGEQGENGFGETEVMANTQGLGNYFRLTHSPGLHYQTKESVSSFFLLDSGFGGGKLCLVQLCARKRNGLRNNGLWDQSSGVFWVVFIIPGVVAGEYGKRSLCVRCLGEGNQSKERGGWGIEEESDHTHNDTIAK